MEPDRCGTRHTPVRSQSRHAHHQVKPRRLARMDPVTSTQRPDPIRFLTRSFFTLVSASKQPDTHAYSTVLYRIVNVELGCSGPWLHQPQVADSVPFTEPWTKRRLPAGCYVVGVRLDSRNNTVCTVYSDGPNNLHGQTDFCLDPDLCRRVHVPSSYYPVWNSMPPATYP